MLVFNFLPIIQILNKSTSFSDFGGAPLVECFRIKIIFPFWRLLTFNSYLGCTLFKLASWRTWSACGTGRVKSFSDIVVFLDIVYVCSGFGPVNVVHHRLLFLSPLRLHP